MGFGVGFRVAPGIRLRSTRRGPRLSLGPRIARVHLGGGGPTVSTGHGPVTVWHSLSGGGHPPANQPARRGRKAEEWASIRNHLDELLSQHEREVVPARPPEPPAPPPVSRSQVRRELRTPLLEGVPWWALGRRRAVARTVAAQLPAAVAAREQARQREHAADLAAAAAWWQALVANDPQTVLGRLEAAFADQGYPASPTAVEGATAHVVLSVLPVEKLIGPREPTVTEAGNLSLARMTKTRRHELFQAAVGSAAVAVAAEVFATCPGLQAVDLAVVCPDHLGGPAVLLLAELPRDSVLPPGANRPVAGPLTTLAAQGRARLVTDRGGRIGAWRPLAEEDPDVRALLDVLDHE